MGAETNDKPDEEAGRREAAMDEWLPGMYSTCETLPDGSLLHGFGVRCWDHLLTADPPASTDPPGAAPR